MSFYLHPHFLKFLSNLLSFCPTTKPASPTKRVTTKNYRKSPPPCLIFGLRRRRRFDSTLLLLCEENGSPIFTDPLRPRTHRHHARNGCWVASRNNPPETYLFFCSVLELLPAGRLFIARNCRNRPQPNWKSCRRK